MDSVSEPEIPEDLIAAFLPLAEAELAERRARWASDPTAFRMDNRRIGPDRSPYRHSFLPWQEEHIFLPMDAAKSLWNEAPRGHDRTDAEGWQVCRDLQYGPPDQRIIIAAADKDQAAMPIARALRYCEEDREVFPDLSVEKHEIKGPNRSVALVISSDVASSLGEKPTCVYLEEVGAWPERGRALKDSILGSCMKTGAPIRVFTNAGAGRVGNWRWDLREWFRQMATALPDRYHFWSAPGWVADWSRPMMEEMRGGMTRREARRFLDNVWLEQDEDAAFDAAEVDAIFDRGCYPDPDPKTVLAYVQASDFGLSNDALCCAVVALDREDVAWVLDDYAVAGRPGAEASLQAAEEHMLAVCRSRPIEVTLFDPYQAVHTMQAHKGALRAEEYTFTQTTKRRHYQALAARVRAGKLKARPGAFRRTHANGEAYDLRRELMEAVEKHNPAGAIMVHSEGGHDDAAVTVAMCCERLSAVGLGSGKVYVPKEEPRRPVMVAGLRVDPRSRFAR